MNRRIYVYTTPAERLLGYVKVGETSRREPGESGVRARIEAQFGTANSSKEYELLAWWPSEVKDVELFEQRFLKPLRVSRNREWFRCDAELVRRAYNDLVHGVNRPDSYEMRPEQVACVDKASSYFEAGGSRFLIDAKMRFGKTHVAYQIAKRLGAARVLIMSYKTASEDSWQDDAERHIAFDGYKFNRVVNGDVGPGIYFSSMQGVLADDRADEAKREWIQSVKWDLVVLDEEHYGTRTESAQKVLDSLNFKHILSLSGTPFKARLGGEFSDDQTFVWGYVDEQLAKRNWDSSNGPNPYEDLPEMHFLCYSFGELIKRKSKYYTEDEQFRLAKLFATDEQGRFIHESAVITLLDLISGHSDEKESSTSPWHSEAVRGHQHMLDHMLWMLISVAACRAMKSLMSKHRYFRDIEVIDASGNNVTRISEVKSIIEKAIISKRRTITLSCDRFTEAVTVKQWGAVFFLDETTSPAKYWQAAFRCQSQWKGEKQRCFVVDLNPHRTLLMQYKMCDSRSRSLQETEKNVINMHDCAPAFFHGENGIIVKSVEEIIEIGEQEIQNPVEKIASLAAINKLSNISENAAQVLMNLDPIKAASIVKIITESDVARGKIGSIEKKQNDKLKPKEDNKIVEKMVERIQKMLEGIPSYLFITETNEESCRDITEYGNDSLFVRKTGVSIDVFKMLLDNKVLDEDYLDSCIVNFSIMERKIAPLWTGK